MLNILLVEDDLLDQRIFKRYLNQSETKHYLKTCIRLDQANDIIENDGIDLVFCDYNLPDGTALDFLNVQKRSNNTLTIVITSLGDVEKATNSLKNGAFDFITKDNINTPSIERIIQNASRHLNESKLRRNLEQKLAVQSFNTKAILDSSIDGIWSLSTEGKLLIINDRAKLSIEKYLDYSPQIDDSFLDNLPPEYSNVWKDMFEKAVLGESNLSLDKFLLGSDTIYLETSVTPIIHEQEILGVVFISSNVTKRKISDDLIRESEKNFRSIFEGADLPIFLESIDDRKIIELNNACALLHGYEAGEMVGMSVFDTIPPDYLQESQINYQKFLKGESDYLDSYVYTSKKQKIPVRIDLTQINYKGKKCNLLFLHDISSQKEFEEKLLEQRLFAEKTAEFKSKFLANMSHEIRTPMNAVVGFTDLLLETTLDDEQNEFVSHIKKSGENLLVIINDILDISKIQAGKLELRDEVVNIPSLLNKIISFHSPAAEKKGLLLKLNYSREIPEGVNTDSTRLTQILNNLLSNAIKFTKKGTVDLSVKVLEINNDSCTLNYCIKDTGIGVPKESLGAIFDDFTQVDSSLQRAQTGTGLGLPIVNDLVELMGGKISIKSDLKVGSEFDFTLTYAIPEVSQNVKIELSKNEQKFDQLDLLIVEDNEVNLILAKRILSKLGIRPRVATNGKEAIDQIQMNEPDIVFMDIQMPVMDGRQATELIRSFSDVPIYAVTAHVLNEEYDKCIKVGMNGFVPKPYSKEDLIKVLTEILIHKQNDKKISIDFEKLGFQNLLALSDGDEQFAISLLQTALKNWIIEIVQLKDSFNQQDFSEVKYFAHKMRSSLTLLGFDELCKLTIKIEENPSDQESVKKFIKLVNEEITKLKLLLNQSN